jgi:hypothetical protein
MAALRIFALRKYLVPFSGIQSTHKNERLHKRVARSSAEEDFSRGPRKETGGRRWEGEQDIPRFRTRRRNGKWNIPGIAILPWKELFERKVSRELPLFCFPDTSAGDFTVRCLHKRQII